MWVFAGAALEGKRGLGQESGVFILLEVSERFGQKIQVLAAAAFEEEPPFRRRPFERVSQKIGQVLPALGVHRGSLQPDSSGRRAFFSQSLAAAKSRLTWVTEIPNVSATSSLLSPPK